MRGMETNGIQTTERRHTGRTMLRERNKNQWNFILQAAG
jgi:hypothetical protein